MLLIFDINSIVTPFPGRPEVNAADDEFGQFNANGVSFFASDKGIFRYFYSLNGKPLAAIHIAAKDLMLGKITAVYADPAISNTEPVAKLLARVEMTFLHLILSDELLTSRYQPGK